jgi:hypothetical protein
MIDLNALGQRAQFAAAELCKLSSEKIKKVLKVAARYLRDNTKFLMASLRKFLIQICK